MFDMLQLVVDSRNLHACISCCFVQFVDCFFGIASKRIHELHELTLSERFHRYRKLSVALTSPSTVPGSREAWPHEHLFTRASGRLIKLFEFIKNDREVFVVRRQLANNSPEFSIEIFIRSNSCRNFTNVRMIATLTSMAFRY